MRGMRVWLGTSEPGCRHDWGPHYTAHQFQAELRWLGIRSTASYVGEPECNRIAERFIVDFGDALLNHELKSALLSVLPKHLCIPPLAPVAPVPG